MYIFVAKICGGLDTVTCFPYFRTTGNAKAFNQSLTPVPTILESDELTDANKFFVRITELTRVSVKSAEAFIFTIR